jgi:two-component system chemotaxis response regulator CheY
MSEPATAAADTPTGRTILIADDSAMMRTMIKRAIALTGVAVGHVYEAADGAEALAILNQHRVDVLFTDVNMPVMTGIELLRAIADDPRWSQVVRVIISTDGSDARRAEADTLHVRLYVDKPFRPEVMRDVLSSLAPTC